MDYRSISGTAQRLALAFPRDRLRHLLALSFKSVSVHRLRSTLSILGIFLGVASVILMLAVGEGARHEALQQIQDLGATNIIVRSVKPAKDDQQTQQQGLLSYGLTAQDVDRIGETIPTVKSVTPMREFRQDLRYHDRKLEGRVVSVMPNFLEMNGLRLSRGRFITDLDNERFANVAVLGAETAQILFPFEDPIGRSVHIGDAHYYQVVGVTEARAPSTGVGSLGPQEYNRDVYIPYMTDRVRFGKLVIYHRAGTWQAEKLEISQITVAVDRTEHVRETAAIITGVLDQYHTQKDTSVTVPLDLLEKAEQTQRIFTLVLGAIASISLVVGGIGIMNIMLATVTERTREIGIRRALGARRRDIAWQFLVEAVLLSSAGGLLGVCLGILLSLIVTHFFAFPTIIRLWSPLVAFAVSVSVGLVFGTYPARRAAHMDPIEALRHE
jgi:putative ABC transport system permease protein